MVTERQREIVLRSIERNREFVRAKAALSALSGLPDAATVAAHVDSICSKLGWAAEQIERLDAE